MENKITPEQIASLKKQAHELVIKLLPLDKYGTNPDAKNLYDNIEDLGNHAVVLINLRDQLLKNIDSWKKDEQINNEHIADLQQQIQKRTEERNYAIDSLKNGTDEFTKYMNNADTVINQLAAEKEAHEKQIAQLKEKIEMTISYGSLNENLLDENKTLADALTELYDSIVKANNDDNIDSELETRIKSLLKTEKISPPFLRGSTASGGEGVNNESPLNNESIHSDFICCENCEQDLICKQNKQCVSKAQTDSDYNPETGFTCCNNCTTQAYCVSNNECGNINE